MKRSVVDRWCPRGACLRSKCHFGGIREQCQPNRREPRPLLAEATGFVAIEEERRCKADPKALVLLNERAKNTKGAVPLTDLRRQPVQENTGTVKTGTDGAIYLRQLTNQHLLLHFSQFFCLLSQHRLNLDLQCRGWRSPIFLRFCLTVLRDCTFLCSSCVCAMSTTAKIAKAARVGFFKWVNFIRQSFIRQDLIRVLHTFFSLILFILYNPSIQ